MGSEGFKLLLALTGGISVVLPLIYLRWFGPGVVRSIYSELVKVVPYEVRSPDCKQDLFAGGALNTLALMKGTLDKKESFFDELEELAPSLFANRILEVMAICLLLSLMLIPLIFSILASLDGNFINDFLIKDGKIIILTLYTLLTISSMFCGWVFFLMFVFVVMINAKKHARMLMGAENLYMAQEQPGNGGGVNYKQPTPTKAKDSARWKLLES